MNRGTNDGTSALEIDIAFLPLQGSGVQQEQRVKIEKGVISLVNQLQPGQAGTRHLKRIRLVRGIPNPKSQIPNEGVSCGQILNALGEG